MMLVISFQTADRGEGVQENGILLGSTYSSIPDLQREGVTWFKSRDDLKGKWHQISCLLRKSEERTINKTGAITQPRISGKLSLKDFPVTTEELVRTLRLP